MAQQKFGFQPITMLRVSCLKLTQVTHKEKPGTLLPMLVLAWSSCKSCKQQSLMGLHWHKI